MATPSRLPLSAAAVGILVIALGGAVAVMVAGGPERWAAVAILLLAVPMVVAIGGATDEAFRTMPQPYAPAGERKPPVRRRLTFAEVVARLMRVLVIATMCSVAVVAAWFAVRAWATGDVVTGCLMSVFALISGWRGWQMFRRRAAR